MIPKALSTTGKVVVAILTGGAWPYDWPYGLAAIGSCVLLALILHFIAP